MYGNGSEDLEGKALTLQHFVGVWGGSGCFGVLDCELYSYIRHFISLEKPRKAKDI